ncbi:CocE/NonD family hydrolase [Nocardioides nanhaiensis]|uniref:CocE/NonD family hydrolase n=1 Tax=Nocardioides nanhaiensis TaxID=1476871 RepID=A0ABP8W6S2_9ACTN
MTVLPALLAALLLVTPAQAIQAAPASAAEQERPEGGTPLTVAVTPEPDGGQVSLEATLFLPPEGTAGADDDGRYAAVMLAHGFGGSQDDLFAQARELAAEGFVVLTWTARGFGGSGGRIHLNAPDYEVDDVSRLLDLLAARPEVRLDAAGDPRVGIAGGSYGGAIALLAAGSDDRVDALVPAITWHDLAQSLVPQSVVGSTAGDAAPQSPAAVDPVATAGVFKKRWASLFFASGLGSSQGGDAEAAAEGGSCGRFDPTVCRAFLRAATTGVADEATLELLRASSPAAVLDRVEAPTLLVQGAQDSLFGLDQADATARALAAAGTPVAVRWIDGGHDAAADTSFAEDLLDPSLAWFDHYLRGGPDPGAAFDFTLPVTGLDDGPPERRRAGEYPLAATDGAGADIDSAVVEREALDLAGGTQTLVAPPGGEPAALTSLPGTGPLLQATGRAGAGYPLAALPGESAVFESQALAEPFTVVGSPRVRLAVTSSVADAVLFASLWVVSADGTATLPRQLVAPMRLEGLTPGEPREVEVALPASAYRVQEGQRLRLVVSTTDAAYALPADPRLYRVGLADGAPDALVLPSVPSERVEAAGRLVPPALLGVVAALLLLALVSALVARRRRRAPVPAPGLEDVPLVVEGLVKAYRNGFRAVDGVSWRAERGQVVGLLGPNGAGKTTTMRMLVGLIRADAGTVHVHGEPVVAGSPVLRRVGALIEGPGFLPHLSGRENLHAYWAATGRPEHEAGFEEALEVADLGVAVEKPVRSYSQGMRQRLGIAQAMLGRPEVLLLDEPTNGLDPPQIRAMRGVLARYAAAGRTVVVSSHLLAEVEQTCSHVVVMHRGRVVLTGEVAELLEGSQTTLIGVEGGREEALRAALLLGALEGSDRLEEVDVDPDGRVRVRGRVPRPRLVTALVGGRVAVSSVDGRRHLEEVFMGLVGEDRPAQVADVGQPDSQPTSRSEKPGGAR